MPEEERKLRVRKTTTRKPATSTKKKEEKKEEVPVRSKPRQRTTVEKREREEEDSSSKQPTKKRRITKEAEEAPEVYPEPKWDDWKEIYFIGTDWSSYDKIFDKPWNFDHLQKELDEGELKEQTVFLFGVTEPQYINNNVTLVPAIIAVVGEIPAPTKVGITSVQMESEEIIDLKELKMSWVPYNNHRIAAKRRSEFRSKHHFLHCNQRRTRVSKMKESVLRKYEYAMPYFQKPSDLLKDDYPTEVTGVVEVGGRGVNFSFDWSTSTLAEYVEELCDDNEITDEKQIAKIKDAIKDDAKKRKEENQKEKDAKQKEYDAIPADIKEKLDNMKKYKFYPQNQKPFNLQALSLVSPFINRYYKMADKIFAGAAASEETSAAQ